MTGILIAAAAAPTGAAGGVGHAPNALAYSNVFDQGGGSTQTLTISGIGSGSSTITAAKTGASSLSYSLNGGFANYAGAITVHDGDTLAWTLINPLSVRQNGTVTLTSGGTALGSFTYSLTGNNNY